MLFICWTFFVLAIYFGYLFIKLKTKYRPIENLDKAIEDFEKELNLKREEIEKCKSEILRLQNEYTQKHEVYLKLKHQIKVLNEDFSVLELGLYEPKYNFSSSEEYKKELAFNMDEQKSLLADGDYIEYDNEIDLSKKKFIRYFVKIITNSFNLECDKLLSKVKWDNYKQTEQKIKALAEKYKKSVDNWLYFTDEFINLKLEQLALTHEEALKKKDEYEREKLINAHRKEQERYYKKLEEEKLKAEQEEEQAKKMLEFAEQQAKLAREDEKDKYNKIIEELNKKLEQAQEKSRKISNAQLTKEGDIYIISNIGSFGENIYKIGMTRREQPEERIDELSNASVPFRFDIHAMIHTEDAPALETYLHNYFNDKRVNKVNTHKEYFNVTLEEIEKAVREKLGTKPVFIYEPLAEEYKQTLIKNGDIIIKENIEDDFPIKI